jgi:ubiquinone/menaquinone biosynthesis C-methylase UbiE
MAAEWWRRWFGPAYLELYDGYLSERTEPEVDQLVALLGLTPPLRILDLGCGQGRHAIELARRGYQVTAIDISTYLLEVARRRALEAGVQVRWIEQDMRHPLESEGFDLALSLFTSFGYFESDADNQAVLQAAARALTSGGRLVLEVLHGDRAIALFREHEWFTVGQATVVENRSLDQSRRRLNVQRTVLNGVDEQESYHSIRLYGGDEIRATLEQAGFKSVDLWGDWNGEPLTGDSLRMIAVAHR